MISIDPMPRTRAAFPFSAHVHAAALLVACAVLFGCGRAAAEPINPTRDDEVVEILPAASADRADERRRRAMLATRPGDAALAVDVARRDLQRARATGDPRYAGLAIAALKPWPDPAAAPDDVLLMRATLQQFLHEFDPSIETLRTLLARPGSERRAQAWLTLATVYRVRGRLADSDAACRRVMQAGAQLHGDACRAENAGLRGDVASARNTFVSLIESPGATADTQIWLLTSLAELEERDGRAAQAERAFRAIDRLGSDSYAALAHADFLLHQKRPAEALRVLKDEPRTDAVLLRLAIAGQRAKTGDAERDAAELRARIALANERPDAKVVHGREQAMFALWVEHRPADALALASGDVSLQREPIDLLVFAAAARATADPAAIDEARRLVKELPLHDRRIDALL